MGPLVRTVWRSYQRSQALQAPLHARPRPSADRLSDGRGPARRGRPDTRAVTSTPRSRSTPSRSRSLDRAPVANSRMARVGGDSSPRGPTVADHAARWADRPVGSPDATDQAINEGAIVTRAAARRGRRHASI